VVIGSLLFAVVSSIVQLRIKYGQEIRSIQASLKMVETTHLPSIAASLYEVNDQQLEVQLAGLLNYRDIACVELIEHRGDQNFKLSAGDAGAGRDIVRILPVIYDNPAIGRMALGELTVTASREGIYDRLWEAALITMTTTTLQTLLIGLLVLGLFHFVVTRNLIRMARYADQLSAERLDIPLSLDRNRTIFKKPDEFDQLADAVNDLRLRLQQHIAKREEAEEALRESEIRLRKLVEQAADAIYLSDPDGRIADVNEMACNFLGYTKDELLSLHVWEVDERFHSRDRYQRIADALKPGQPVEIETHFLRKDGSTLPVEVRLGGLELKTGLHVLAMVRDITDRKLAEVEKTRLEKQLRHAQKMEAIGTLAGGIAHDFNNILGGIIGYAELAVERRPPDDPKMVKYTARILEGGRRAKDLVAQILTVSRQMETALGFVDIAPIVKEALKLLRSSLPTTIEIRQEITTGVSVMADPSQIHQVVMNLCTNAAHAMEAAGGVLTVTLSAGQPTPSGMDPFFSQRAARCQVLTVRDTGAGIPETILNKIFDPYFTTKAPGEGTGLGLAVVDGIIKKMGGHIDIQSEPERGTAFSVYLPEHEQPSDLTVVPPQEALPTGNEHILVVDDEEILMELNADVLKGLGYRVTTAASAETAFEIFCENPRGFDMILTDMTMPRMTGLDLAREISRIEPGKPILLCTGFSRAVSEDDVGQYGISGLIYKPISKARLAKTIREVIKAG
jgi:PAS domain S-box-containing protein